MLSRNQIKYIADLNRKSNRVSEQKFVVEGEKLVSELLSSDFQIEIMYATDNWECPAGIAVERISDKDLIRISQLKTPNKVLAIAKIPEVKIHPNAKVGLILFLDHINDPGNLGTIIRMADWFGVKRVVCTENSVDVFNSKVIQSSMGSVFRIPVEYVDGVEFLHEFSVQFPEIPILGAAMQGENLGKFEFPTEALMVMGSESHGIDEKLIPFISRFVTIPKFGNAESLNVGVATGILLWEWKRK